MFRKQISKLIPAITLITYIVMVSVNALANTIPINGRGTGEISDSYENLFAPAGLTFAIWGLIYLLLLGFTLYQLSYYKNIGEDKKSIFVKIGLPFSISSIVNTLWIFAWHYEYILVSLILMILLLICLIIINLVLKKVEFEFLDKLLIRLPFTVYFGWITVATIANVTTFLVYINWDQLGLPEYLWADIVILAGAVIGVLAMLFYNSKAYGAVIIWAYVGIAIKHLSSNGFNGEYSSVIATVFASIILLIIGELMLLKIQFSKKSALKKESSGGVI